jgi:hypothetical protein
VDIVWLLPHQEAYFNLVAGGPENGARVLVDSNLDWGQDLIALRKLLQERGIERPYLAYFGTALPEAYGISYKPIPAFLRFTTGPEIEVYNPYTPLPGWYAISRSSLHLGLLHQNVDMYAYFRDKEPVARAGYSINLYRVEYPAGTPVTRTVVTGRSVADVSPDELGVVPGQRVIAKWAASADTAITPATAASMTPSPANAVEANFADVLTLVGYDLQPDAITVGRPLTLTLTWRVGNAAMPQPAPATAPPLAAFVHLSGIDPASILAQYDGWGTALAGLEAGDIVQQTVLLNVPQAPVLDAYYVQIGLYSPQSTQRLTLKGSNESFVRLGPFTPPGTP